MSSNAMLPKSLVRPISLLILALFVAAVLAAHPMGNFSVNHYARLDLGPRHTQLTYILDLAEIPTLELLQNWKLSPAPDSGLNDAALKSAAERQARMWLHQLHISENGTPVPLQLQSSSARLSDGVGGLHVLRVEISAQFPAHPGALEYQDSNYLQRTGWKEIVIRAQNGVSIARSSESGKDRSHALQIYPVDEIAAPPQDMHSTVTWSLLPSALPAPPTPARPQPLLQVASQPPTVSPTAPAFNQQQPSAPGSLSRGDYLSRMLRNHEIPFGLALLGVLFAFSLGAMHALSPGHGKTIVAAYLVGTHGTLQHALFLGGMVTFTHTITVFALGLGVLFFERYIVPDQVIPILGAVSGLSIVAIGLLLMYQRTKALADAAIAHQHTHSHDHAYHHTHTHPHDHAHPHSHEHAHDHPHTHPHVHSHGGGKPHAHLPEGKVSLGSLVALGVSGGLVPCPSALILLLSAIALGRTGLGLVLLLGFSAGLALVLIAIGAAVIYAKRLLPEGRGLRAHPAFRYVPVFSALVVVVLGLIMTGVSIGWITPRLSI